MTTYAERMMGLGMPAGQALEFQTILGEVVVLEGGTIDGATIDDSPIGGTTRAAGKFTTLGANGAVTFSDGGAMTGTWTDLGTVTTVDINGGTADGVVIGGATPAAATVTALVATTAVISANGLRPATSTPASAAATGVAGTITWDASYIYVCTATNTWKRASIATW